jgi:hypothetical protein
MTAVLHTWGQSLVQHVHLLGLVPGWALADDGRWVPVKGSYLFPVKALSRRSRGRMVSALRNAANDGKLAGLDPVEVSAVLEALMAEHWVVSAKPCLAHTGLLANRCRVQRLAQIRKILAAPPPEPTPEGAQGQAPEPGWPCPVCRQGRMRPVREIAPRPPALGGPPYR